MSQSTYLTPADVLLIPATDPVATVGVFFTVAELRDAMSPIGFMTPGDQIIAAAAEAAQATASAAIPAATLNQPNGPAQLDSNGTANAVNIVYSGPGAVATGLQVLINNTINPAGYNASGSVVVTAGSISAGSNALILTSAIDFKNGQGIYVTGAGAAGAPLITTIASGAGTNSLVLAAAASTAVTGAIINHDDTAAWNAAALAANNISAASGGFTSVNGGGLTYHVSGPIVAQTGIILESARVMPLASPNWIGGTGTNCNAVLQNISGYNVVFRNLYIDLNRVPNVNGVTNAGYGFVKMQYIRITHWSGTGNGIVINGDIDAGWCDATQWNKSDIEATTPITSNSGYALYHNSHDSSYTQCNFAMGLRPVYIANGNKNIRFVLCHTYTCDIISTQVLPDPCNMEIHGDQITIVGHYLDTGYIGVWQEYNNANPAVNVGVSQSIYENAIGPYPGFVKLTTTLQNVVPGNMFIDLNNLFTGGPQALLLATAIGVTPVAGTNTGNGTISGQSLTSNGIVGAITLTALSATSFAITGSIAGTATVGVAYTSSTFGFLINAGSIAFAVGDLFFLTAAMGSFTGLVSPLQTAALAAQTGNLQVTDGGGMIADVGKTPKVLTVMGNNLATVASVASGSNVGNGTVGSMSISLGTPPGIYVLTAMSATSFNLSGSGTGTASVGTPYTSSNINFLLTAGGTAFAAGDSFTLTATAGYSLAKYIDGGATLNAAPEFGSNGNDAVVIVDNTVRLRGSYAGLGVILGQSNGLEGYAGNTSVTANSQKIAHQFLNTNAGQPWVAGLGMPGGNFNNKSAWFWGAWDASGSAGTNMKTVCYSDGSLVHPTFDYVVSEFGSLASVTATGIYQIASSTVALQGELAGTYEIYWAAASARLQHMIVSVGSAKGDNAALVTVLHNWCKSGNAVITAPEVVQDAVGNAYLVVTVNPSSGGTLSAQARGYSTGVSVSSTPGGSIAITNQLASLNTTGGPAATVTLSPTVTSYAYTAAAAGQLAIYGGTVSAITRKRGSSTVHYNSATSEITVGVGDIVAITNTAVPAVTFFPA
jgi:hypothetical protein